MYKIVMIRHGESLWNKENLFTGWTDVDITEQGIAEAKEAGRRLKEAGFTFDEAHTSVLKRAIRTLWLVLDEMDIMHTPIQHDWRLNERHYGALQGLDKAETAQKYGDEQVLIWRRSYDVPPPPLAEDDPRFPGFDPRYRHLDPAVIPQTESLEDTVRRFLPYWQDVIVPEVVLGRNVLVVAHGNSLRALVKHLDGLSDAEVVALNIPTGEPLLYRLDENLRIVESRYLGNEEQVRAKMGQVAAQGKGNPPVR